MGNCPRLFFRQLINYHVKLLINCKHAIFLRYGFCSMFFQHNVTYFFSSVSSHEALSCAKLSHKTFPWPFIFLVFFSFLLFKIFMFYQAKNYNISKSCLIAIVRNCLLKIGKISPINRCTYTIQNLSLFKIVCFLTISLLLPILVKSFCHARNRLT